MRRKVEIGPATLILGDAYEERPKLGWQDAEIWDPPYIIATSGGGKFRKNRPYLNQISENEIDKGFDHSIINPLTAGSVCIFMHNDQVPALSSHLQGLFQRFVMGFWSKPNPIPVANKHLLPDVEIYIRAWNKGYHPIGEIADKRRGIVLEEDPEASIEAISASGMPSKTFGHPTVKPIPLMRKILRTTPGETVCDAFMGTGSTGVAAIQEGRQFTGIEHNEEHFQTACQRIEETFQQIREGNKT